MNIMIVGADQESQHQLAAWVPISSNDRVIEASGMLSALWYAETCHPDLIVLDMLPPDYCGQQLAELLRRTCPEARLLVNDPIGGFQLLQTGEDLPVPSLDVLLESIALA